MLIDREARNLSIDTILRMKMEAGETVAVVIPALNESATIGRELAIIQEELMKKAPVVDELIVMDGDSEDNTVEIVESFGIPCYSAVDGIAEPYPRGKGLAMWRSLSYVKSSIVVFVDADIENFSLHFITAQMVPFFRKKSIGYVKAFYERPIVTDGVIHAGGGGRVTELLVRPLFSRFYPEAARLIQPLAGEYAFRTELLKQLVFYSGYGVETSLTLDFIRKFGVENIAQVDLGVRIHRNRPLSELGLMSAIIVQTFVDFADEDDILQVRGDDLYFPEHAGEFEKCELEQVRLPLFIDL